MENLNSLIKRGFLLFAAIIPAMLMATAMASPVALESWSDVIAAVDQVNLDGSGTIRLASHSVIIVNEPLPVVVGNLVIEGNGARLDSAPDYHGALIQIDEAGSLELKDLHITSFDRDTFQSPQHSLP